MEKIIGDNCYRKINGLWCELSECGYVFKECSEVLHRFVELWICK